MFRRAGHDETILTKDETIFRFWRITHETTHGYQLHNDGTGGHRFGDKTMRALSFLPSASCLPVPRSRARRMAVFPVSAPSSTPVRR
ncbi:hypothetical protein IVB12_26335 [Bradyrhizobium sp. 179]|nr:hypothetical protein [Bradyrhizobium sp. 179]